MNTYKIRNRLPHLPINQGMSEQSLVCWQVQALIKYVINNFINDTPFKLYSGIKY